MWSSGQVRLQVIFLVILIAKRRCTACMLAPVHRRSFGSTAVMALSGGGAEGPLRCHAGGWFKLLQIQTAACMLHNVCGQSGGCW